jgi:hypothetical protein
MPWWVWFIIAICLLDVLAFGCACIVASKEDEWYEKHLHIKDEK